MITILPSSLMPRITQIKSLDSLGVYCICLYKQSISWGLALSGRIKKDPAARPPREKVERTTNSNRDVKKLVARVQITGTQVISEIRHSCTEVWGKPISVGHHRRTARSSSLHGRQHESEAGSGKRKRSTTCLSKSCARWHDDVRIGNGSLLTKPI
ncbi:hypothetical protein BJV74DRAFT_294998 [Russula compacta]|nr:hypothetical protein BJV74DRAFT_294998 [Russula compacta]